MVKYNLKTQWRQQFKNGGSDWMIKYNLQQFENRGRSWLVVLYSQRE
jgi:hypothetical protein